MSDLADQANDLADRERESVIAAQMARCQAAHATPRRTHCVVCEDAISPGRLAAVPFAQRCASCERDAQLRARTRIHLQTPRRKK